MVSYISNQSIVPRYCIVETQLKWKISKLIKGEHWIVHHSATGKTKIVFYERKNSLTEPIKGGGWETAKSTKKKEERSENSVKPETKPEEAAEWSRNSTELDFSKPSKKKAGKSCRNRFDRVKTRYAPKLGNRFARPRKKNRCHHNNGVEFLFPRWQ